MGRNTASSCLTRVLEQCDGETEGALQSGTAVGQSRGAKPSAALPKFGPAHTELDPSERRRVRTDTAVLLFLAGTGSLPVTLIGASAFGVAGLRVLALGLLLPAVLTAALFLVRDARLRPEVKRAWVVGLVSTGLYDLFRFGFIWLGLMSGDPIPHIGAALGLHPDWVFGYLWRYAGNGAGLAIAFHALGLRGTRMGVLYGLAVCGGLLVTLTVAPYGQQMLFPLSVTTVVMATGGHVIYGAALGCLSVRGTTVPRLTVPRGRRATVASPA